MSLFIHVGLHKTGTTFLQNDVFPYLTDVDYIHLDNRFLKESQKKWSCQNQLTSSEALSGYPWKNNRKYRNRYENFENVAGKWLGSFENSMCNLSQLFPDSKIIIVFRDHNVWIKSLYKQYLHEGGSKKFDDFFSFEDKKTVLAPIDFSFESRINILLKYFERENVFIGNYIEFRSDKENFLKKLNHFVGAVYKDADVRIVRKHNNLGVKRTQAGLLRQFNRLDNLLSKSRFLPTMYNRLFHKLGISPRIICQNKLSFIDSRDIEMSALVRTEIDEFYSSDWQFVIDNCN